jgi:hypothetical protein
MHNWHMTPDPGFVSSNRAQLGIQILATCQSKVDGYLRIHFDRLTV